MPKRFYKTVLVCLVLAVLLPLAAAVYEYLNAREADRLLAAGKYDEALERYHRALRLHPDAPSLRYGAGLALYKKKEYPKARDSFAAALTAEDRGLKFGAALSLGNCWYREAEQAALYAPGTAMEHYRKALHSYTEAAGLDAGDEKVRHNTRLAETKLKVLLAGRASPNAEGRQKEQPGEGGDLPTDHRAQADGAAEKRENATAEGAQGKKPSPPQSLAHKGKKAGPLSKEEAELLLAEYRRSGSWRGEFTGNRKSRSVRTLEKDW